MFYLRLINTSACSLALPFSRWGKFALGSIRAPCLLLGANLPEAKPHYSYPPAISDQTKDLPNLKNFSNRPGLHAKYGEPDWKPANLFECPAFQVGKSAHLKIA
jgi:hypothetical protein